MKISMYKDSFDKVGVEVDMFAVLRGIKEGRWRDKVDHVRSFLHDKDEYASQKRYLPSVTFGGTFSARRANALKEYTSLLVVDIDHIGERMQELSAMFREDGYVMCFFTSPSYDGMKVLVKLSSPPDKHRDVAFVQVEAYFKHHYGVDIDKSGKDVSRLCYVTYDPYLHYKESLVFPVSVESHVSSNGYKAREDMGPITTDPWYIYDVCKKWTDERQQFTPGNRNNYRHLLASNLNRCGVSREDAIMLIDQGLPPAKDDRWHQTVKSAYGRTGEHGSVFIYEVERKKDMEKEKVYESDEYDINTINVINTTLAMYRANIKWRYIHTYICSVRDKICVSLPELSDKVISLYEEERSSSVSNIKTLDQYEDDILNAFMNMDVVMTYIPSIDDEFGGLSSGNIYALCGPEKTFKSIVSLNACVENAKRGIETVYCNLEMSYLQFYNLVAYMVTGVNMDEMKKAGTLTYDIIKDVSSQIRDIVKKIHVISEIGMSAEKVQKNVESIRLSGGNPKLLFIDGISHLDQLGKENDAWASIENSKLLKEVAKNLMMPVIFLSHTTNDVVKHDRNPIESIRGGQKVRANLDGYISTSLIVDQERSTFSHNKNTESDILYIPRMVWIRAFNARGAGALIDTVYDLNRNLNLTKSDKNPRSFEYVPPSR